MTNSVPPKPPVDSERQHRRESFWQITFPLLVMVVLIGVGFTLVVLTGATGIARVSDVAATFAGLPLLLLCAITIPLLAVGFVAIGQALDFIPPYTQIAQKYTARASEIVQTIAKRITDLLIPVITGLSMAGRFLGGQNGKEDEQDETTGPGGKSA